MNKNNSLKLNTIFNAIYQILALLVPLVTTPFVSRMLGPESIGQYSFYFSIVSYFTLIAAFGFNDLGTKEIAETRDDKIKKTNVFFSLLISKLLFGVLVIGVFLIYVFVASNDLNTFICYLCLGLYILATILDFTFFFQGEEKFIGICLRNIATRVFTLVLIFVLIKSSEDLRVYCLILGVGQLFASLIMCFGFRRNTFTKIILKDLHPLRYIKLAFPYFIPALSVSLFTYLNQVLLGAMNVSDAENGYYGMAVKIAQILSVLAGSISIIMFSRISYLIQKNNIEEVKHKIRQTFSAFWILSIPLFLGIYAVCDIFVPIFLGPGYDKVVILIYILAPQIVFGPLNGLYGYLYFRPYNKIWIQTAIIFASSIFNIVLAVILIPSYESIGTSIGKVCAEFVQLPFLIYFSRKFINAKETFKESIKPLISGSIMFVVVFLSDYLLGGIILNKIILLIILIFEGSLIYYIFEIVLKDYLVFNTTKQILNFVFSKFRKGKV